MGIVLSSITSFCVYIFGWNNPSGKGFEPSSVAASTANDADLPQLSDLEIMKNSPDATMSYMYQFFPAVAAAIQACKDVCDSVRVKKYENQQQYQMRLFGIRDSISHCEDTEKPHCACQMKNQIQSNEFDLYPYNPDGKWYLTTASAVTRWKPEDRLGNPVEVLAVDGLWNTQIEDNSDNLSKSTFAGDDLKHVIHACRVICQKARRWEHPYNSVRLHGLKNNNCECQVFHDDCQNQHSQVYPYRADTIFCLTPHNCD